MLHLNQQPTRVACSCEMSGNSESSSQCKQTAFAVSIANTDAGVKSCFNPRPNQPSPSFSNFSGLTLKFLKKCRSENQEPRKSRKFKDAPGHSTSPRYKTLLSPISPISLFNLNPQYASPPRPLRLCVEESNDSFFIKI